MGTREELNLENAADHPRYRYFAETGEERYASFLGAPIIHHRRVVGVLVIQQKNAASSTKVKAFLVTMSAQLAGLSPAGPPVRFAAWDARAGHPGSKFVGVPGSPGAAVDTYRRGHAAARRPGRGAGQTVTDIDAEIILFKTALEGVHNDMRTLSTKLATQLRPERAGVVRRVPDDARRRVPGQRSQDVIKTGQWAQGALRQVVTDHVNRFE